MRLVAFAASTSRRSINRALIDYAVSLAPTEIGVELTVEVLDLLDYEMPIFSVDREEESGIPQQAHDLFAAIGRADAVLVSFAEHNGFYTAAYKNTFDWLSRIDLKIYQDKPTVFLATSTGSKGGRNALRTAVSSAPFFGNDLKAELSIPSFNDNFDLDAGKLTNPELDAELRKALAALAPSA
jgi:NAD(P)H-dependent FMN reductase